MLIKNTNSSTRVNLALTVTFIFRLPSSSLSSPRTTNRPRKKKPRMKPNKQTSSSSFSSSSSSSSSSSEQISSFVYLCNRYQMQEQPSRIQRKTDLEGQVNTMNCTKLQFLYLVVQHSSTACSFHHY